MHPALHTATRHFLPSTKVHQGEYCPIISHARGCTWLHVVARGCTRVRLVQWVRGPVVFVRVAAQQPQACIRPGPIPVIAIEKQSFAMVACKKHANAAKTAPFASTRPLIARTTAFFRIKRCSNDASLSLSLSLYNQATCLSTVIAGQQICPRFDFDRLFSFPSSPPPPLLLLLLLATYDEIRIFCVSIGQFSTHVMPLISIFRNYHRGSIHFQRSTTINPKNF